MKRKQNVPNRNGPIAHWFAQTYGCYDAVSAIRKVVAHALDLSHQSTAPVNLDKVSATRSIVRTLYASSLKTCARLQPTNNGFVVALQKDPHWYTRKEWWAHEIAHTFFYDVAAHPPRRLIAAGSREEESLCDLIGRELIIPTSFLKESAIDSNPSISELRRLCKLFRSTLSTMARRLLVDLELWEAVFVVCEKRRSLCATSRIENQIATLRIVQRIGPIKKGRFVPLNKRVEEMPVIGDAFRLNRFVEGTVIFDRIGDLRGPMKIEAAPLPINDQGNQRVMALFHTQGVGNHKASAAQAA